jgi:hypothetical protein
MSKTYIDEEHEAAEKKHIKPEQCILEDQPNDVHISFFNLGYKQGRGKIIADLRSKLPSHIDLKPENDFLQKILVILNEMEEK